MKFDKLHNLIENVFQPVSKEEQRRRATEYNIGRGRLYMPYLDTGDIVMYDPPSESPPIKAEVIAPNVYTAHTDGDVHWFSKIKIIKPSKPKMYINPPLNVMNKFITTTNKVAEAMRQGELDFDEEPPQDVQSSGSMTMDPGYTTYNPGEDYSNASWLVKDFFSTKKDGTETKISFLIPRDKIAQLDAMIKNKVSIGQIFGWARHKMKFDEVS